MRGTGSSMPISCSQCRRPARAETHDSTSCSISPDRLRPPIRQGSTCSCSTKCIPERPGAARDNARTTLPEERYDQSKQSAGNREPHTENEERSEERRVGKECRSRGQHEQ